MISELRSYNYFVNYMILIIILSLCVYEIHVKNIYKTVRETLMLIVICLTFLISCSLLYKIRLFVEELFYINSEYNNNLLSVIKATMSFNSISQIIIGVSLVSFFMLIINTNYDVVQMIQRNFIAFFYAFAFSLLLLYSANILECRTTTVSQIFYSGGLDPGSSIASSYFYGYLKIVLPASGGNERAGILTAMEKYEGNEKIKMPVKKLFILIPSSSYIPPDLREVSNDWLQYSGDLETITLDRAGVKNRVYHNTVYRLYPAGPNVMNKTIRPIYVVAEGATPLKTFLEVQDKSHRYAPLYKEFNREIIQNFYKTLQNLLNENPDCKDYCELVYYEDLVNNQRVNPAHVILEHIARYS